MTLHLWELTISFLSFDKISAQFLTLWHHEMLTYSYCYTCIFESLGNKVIPFNIFFMARFWGIPIDGM